MIIENAIYEYLHMYINPSVQNNEELIQSLRNGKDVKEYVSQMYQDFPWNRVVDENIVRAVETRVYAKVLGD
jgi:hypothetical protein